jgi:3-dehydroquinate dehydratase
MRILVLQGPNLNLIGLQAARHHERVTLDKINKRLRRHAQQASPDVELKFLQTHRVDKAITFLQRNRNWAQGVLLAPMAWARYEYALQETLRWINLAVVQVLFIDEYGSGINQDASILTEVCVATVTEHPYVAFTQALDILVKQLTDNS